MSLSADDKIAQFKAIMSDLLSKDNAAIFESSTSSDQEIRVLQYDLSTAVASTSPKPVGFPFRSFIVIDATDSNVAVNLKIATQDSYQDPLPLKKGGSLKLPYPVKNAYLDWSAQASKTITIAFFVRGEFSTNTLNLVNSGGVSISEGISATSQAAISVTNAATQIVGLDTTRVVAVIENQGGAPIYLGDSSVTAPGGAKPGITLNPGATYDWKNTGALYGISGGANVSIAVMKLT